MSDAILKHIKEEELSISEFADEFCDIVEELYGRHNYKTALNIIDSRLANGDNKEQGKVLRLPGVVFSEAEVCQLKKSEYERGIEDGKIIVEHGTVNWQT